MNNLLDALKKLLPIGCILNYPNKDAIVISCGFGYELEFKKNEGWNTSCIGHINHYQWKNGSVNSVGEPLSFYSERQALGYIMEIWERFQCPELPKQDLKFRPITHWNQLK